MSHQEKISTELNDILQQENIEYSNLLRLDYCGFRLNSLAKKIKSDYLKFRKQERRFINP